MPAGRTCTGGPDLRRRAGPAPAGRTCAGGLKLRRRAEAEEGRAASLPEARKRFLEIKDDPSGGASPPEQADPRRRAGPAPADQTCAGGPDLRRRACPGLGWGHPPPGSNLLHQPPYTALTPAPPPFRLEKCLSNHSTLDHTVAMRDWYDPLLVSKHVDQGTVSPTHYIGVYDNTGLKDKNKTKTPPIGKRVTVNGKSK